jgi:hypothetical protein
MTEIFEAYDIDYETDGARVKGLPKTVRFEAADMEEAEEIAADKVSDVTGWLVNDLSVRRVLASTANVQ